MQSATADPSALGMGFVLPDVSKTARHDRADWSYPKRNRFVERPDLGERPRRGPGSNLVLLEAIDQAIAGTHGERHHGERRILTSG